MAHFSLLTQKLYDKNIGHYTCYGIKAEDNQNSLSVADISTDKLAVQNLIDKFNKYDLSLCHLHVAIEDFLYDLNIN